jgi:tocopherol O-methyltransferase
MRKFIRQSPLVAIGSEVVGLLYSSSFLEYRLFWMDSRSLAFHLGYWNNGTQTHAESLIEMNRAMASYIRVERRDRVLDVGCGVGGTAFWLAKEYGVHVVGVDIASDQIVRARRYAERRALNSLVEFQVKDFLDTRFEPEGFDIVWAQESVLHTAEKRRFVAEAFRLLKPGGRLVIEDMFLARPLSSTEEKKFIGGIEGDCLAPGVGTVAEFTRLAAEIGFVDAAVEDISRAVAPSYRRLHTILRWTQPVSVLMRTLGFRSDLQNRMTRGLLAQHAALREGLMLIGIGRAIKV